MKLKKNNINEKLKGKTIDELLDLVILGLENTEKSLLIPDTYKEISKSSLNEYTYKKKKV